MAFAGGVREGPRGNGGGLGGARAARGESAASADGARSE